MSASVIILIEKVSSTRVVNKWGKGQKTTKKSKINPHKKMVKLSLSAFEDAAKQMRNFSGIHRMRIMIKARPCSRVIVVKATDDKVALVTQVRQLSDLKALERILNEFVGHSMANAPVLPPDAEAGGGKKGKKGKKNTEASSAGAAKSGKK